MSQKINTNRDREVVLYTRVGCHLCDDAEQLLLSHGLIPTLVDIDQVPELRAQFDTCVPVVVIDGRVRFKGRINPMLLQRILDNPESAN